MSREEMIERLIERIQEADSQTLEEFFWYLEMEMEG
jgi:aspartyl/asparaginyl-tRNA synthetase